MKSLDTLIDARLIREVLLDERHVAAVHDALFPYLRSVTEENAETGVPAMRPLFFADPDAPEAWRRENYSYLLGSELLVAPVVEPGAAERRLWLPRGSWVHLWTGEAFDGGAVTVPAPLGQPPVFYKGRGPWAPFFEELRRTLAEKA